jgi:hypothetical protein
MNRDDVTRMAREAQMPFYWSTGEITYLDKLERFAALVASAERKDIIELASDLYYWDHSEALIKTIRARGQA